MELDFRKDPSILSTVVDAMAVGVFTVDAKGSFVAWSEGAERITGYAAAEVLGRPCHILEGQNCKGFSTLLPLLESPDTAGAGICNQECKLQSKAGTEIYIFGSVLLTGESGTGKELAARAIHAMGPRARKPFLAINCSAIPETLLESELFGHVKGAFTGAVRDKIGLFQAADGGTLFLDEIGEVSPLLQVKLLRVLQEREMRRVGDEHGTSIDVRLVTATNKNLKSLIASGQMREDFYYRIRVFEIALPPLRERRDDIPMLIEHFMGEFSRAAQLGLQIRHVFLTHFHADFVAGHLELRDRTGAEIHIGRKARADYRFTVIGDGDRVRFGDVVLQVMAVRSSPAGARLRRSDACRRRRGHFAGRGRCDEFGRQRAGVAAWACTSRTGRLVRRLRNGMLRGLV